ncbi:MAG: metalloregulator ArsR/SmtB family transcription factor [Pseudomonadota bacterium]
MNEPQVIQALGALAQETRLRIVRFLIGCGDAGASAGDIATHVGVGASSASFHLAALGHAGIVNSQRRSRKVIYQAEFAALGGVIAFLLNDCCDNHPDIRACCFDCEPGSSN